MSLSQPPAGIIPHVRWKIWFIASILLFCDVLHPAWTGKIDVAIPAAKMSMKTANSRLKRQYGERLKALMHTTAGWHFSRMPYPAMSIQNKSLSMTPTPTRV